MKTTEFTTEPVQVMSQPASLAEFGRWQDVEKVFKLKRGTLYNLMLDGKIKSISLRRRGRLYGCRLFHMQSIRDYLNSLMEEQNPCGGAPTT